jgi:putative ABC transport system permease protein
MWHDLRFALRLLRRRPVFAATAVVTLALGIGLTTAVFSVVDGVLFRPLPYAEPGRLYALFGAQRDAVNPALPRSVSLPEFQDWERNRSFLQLAAFETAQGPQTQVRGTEESIQVTTASISAHFFDVLGATPVVGRSFRPEEYDARPASVAVISDAVWRKAFRGDPRAMGQTIMRGEWPLTIVGILPPSFVFPVQARRFEPDVLVPGVGWPQLSSSRTHRYLTVIGRLAPGRSVYDARAEMAGIARRIAPLYVPETGNRDTAFDAVTVRPLGDYLGATSRPVLRLVFGAVVLLLVLACVNVAGLLLSRGPDRERELAIRTAMGAGRSRIMRQLLVESSVLAIVSSLAGWCVAFVTLEVMTARIPSRLQLIGEPHLNARALALTMGCTVLVVFACGLAPTVAWCCRAAGRLPVAGHTFSPRRRGRGVIALEVALSTVLLAGGAVLLHSWLRLQSADVGVDATRVMVIRSVPSGPFSAPDRVRYTQRVVDALRRVPGAEAVSFTDVPILSRSLRGSSFIPPLSIPGTAAARQDTDMLVGPHYFETMGIPIRQGRALTDGDRGRAVVVSETLARRYWPDRSPVGEVIRYGDGTRHIVGVVGDVRDYAMDMPPMSTMYHAWDDTRGLTATMMVRFSGPATAIATRARAAIRSIDEGAMVTVAGTYTDLLGRSVAERSFNTMLLGFFAAAGLLITLVGLYGVVAVHVLQRRQEMAIRAALGATPRRLNVAVVRSALVPVAIGVVLGTGCAILAAEYLQPFVYEVEPADPWTLGLVSLLFLALAAAASFLAGRGVAGGSPLAALRAD